MLSVPLQELVDFFLGSGSEVTVDRIAVVRLKEASFYDALFIAGVMVPDVGPGRQLCLLLQAELGRAAHPATAHL